MSMDRLHLRFNKKNEADRKVVAYLESMDVCHQSRNRQVIDLLAGAIDRLETQKQEDALVEKIRQIFREELPTIPVSATPTAAPAFSIELTEEEAARNAASVLADLELFG